MHQGITPILAKPYVTPILGGLICMLLLLVIWVKKKKNLSKIEENIEKCE